MSVSCIMCRTLKQPGSSTCRQCKSVTFCCDRCGWEVPQGVESCPRCSRQRLLVCVSCATVRDPRVAECPTCHKRQIYCDGCYSVLPPLVRDCQRCAPGGAP